MEELKAIEDFKEILRAGADKISVNSAAIRNPELITEACKKIWKPMRSCCYRWKKE